MKSNLIDRLGMFLLKDGFTVKSLTRICFDLLARKHDKILLIKVLEDANAVTKEYTDAMNTISSYIGAIPIIIAEKAGNKLEDNVLYTRFNLYTLNYLSKKVGVTSRMIDIYEKGDSEITINKAMKIYDIFGHQVFNEINIFSGYKKIESRDNSDFSKKYITLGFEASDTKKSPFDVIAKKDNELILTKVGDKARPDFPSLSKLLDADNLVIFKKKKPKDIPAVTKKEFLEFEKANELIKFLKEF